MITILPQQIGINTLKLNNFRNYKSLKLELENCESVLISGCNGSGKTNLLEAVSLLLPGKGLRNSQTAQYQMNGQTNSWAIYGSALGLQGDVTIGTTIGQTASGNEKRVFKLNGNNLKRQDELLKELQILHLTPDRYHLFIEGSTSRRRFLDKLVMFFDTSHKSHLAVYDNAKFERKKLLDMDHIDQIWLKALEKRMSEHGVRIASSRLVALEHIKHHLESDDLTLNMELSVTSCLGQMLENDTAINTEEYFAKALHDNRDTDAARGQTSFGVHKDDFIVTYKDKNMPAQQCSTGEQKMLLLGLFLATANALKNRHGNAPIILLDEVAAHLDEARRQMLFDKLETLKTQCWMTSTDDSIYDGFKGKNKRLFVEDGKLIV